MEKISGLLHLKVYGSCESDENAFLEKCVPFKDKNLIMLTKSSTFDRSFVGTSQLQVDPDGI